MSYTGTDKNIPFFKISISCEYTMPQLQKREEILFLVGC